MIPIDLIDEDPDQPRSKDNPGFAPDSIAELAATYGPKGPKSPISVRVNPANPKRYLINHGARRTRAGRLKGLPALPAFIDNDYSEVDQVIENLQRDNLTPREIAEWIGRELARGKKKSEIAQSVGKSAAFVTQHAHLLNMPEAIATAFNAGRTNDVTVVSELITAFKKNPGEVTGWLSNDHGEITRSGVRMLRDFLEQRPRDSTDPTADSASRSTFTEKSRSVTVSESAPPKPKMMIVQIEHNGCPGRLVLSLRPSATGLAWIKNEDDGVEHEVSVTEIALKSVVEG